MSNQEELLEEEYDELDDDYLYDDEEPAQYESIAETGGEVSQPSKGNAASPSSASAEKKEPYKANKNKQSNDNTTENKKTEGSKTGDQKKESPYKGKDNNSNPANKKTLSKENKSEKKPQAKRNAPKSPKQSMGNKFKGKKSLASLGAKAKSLASGAVGGAGGGAGGGAKPTAGDKLKQASKDKTKELVKKAATKNPYILAICAGLALIALIVLGCAAGGAAGGDEDSESANSGYGSVTVKKLCSEITVKYSDSGTSEIYDLEDYVVLKLLEEVGNEDISPNENTIYLPTDDIKAASVHIRTVIVNELKDNDTCTVTMSTKENYDEELVDIINIGVGNTRGLVMMNGSDYYTEASLPGLSIYDEHDIEDEIEQESKTKKAIVSDVLGIDESDFELKQIFAELNSNTGTIAMNTNNNTLCNTSSAEANIVTFIGTWEGTNGYCDNGNGYIASDKLDGVPTAGYGVSNHALSSLTSYINEKGYGQYFHVNSNGKYYMNDGDCVPVSVIDDLKYAFIEKNSLYAVEQWQKNNPDVVLTQYQKDAIGSFNYNVGPAYTNEILDDYKEKGYEGVWEYISKYKYYKNKEGKPVESDALKKRRKAEFALFVTGDYTDQGKFYNRSLENYEDINSEGVFEREAICQMPDENGLQVDVNSGFIMRTSRPLRDNSIYYDQSTTDQLAYTDFEGECAWYAGFRAKEILQQIGSDKTWPESSMPDGGEYCYTSEVTSGRFSSSKDVNQPKQGALISWDNGEYGHVAVIEKVNDDGSITISEGAIRFGSVADRDTLHSMYDTYGVKGARKINCEGNNSGCFNTRTIEKDKINKDFVCYIYLID